MEQPTQTQIDAWRAQAQDDQQRAAAMEIVDMIFNWIVQDVLHLDLEIGG